MLNHIVIMGRLTHNPELRRTAAGAAVASFSVAVDRDFAPQGQEKETDFIDCVAWRHTGEFVSKYFSKGSMIVVSGRLQVRSWTDRDGNKRRTAEIVADNCYFGESKRSPEGRQASGGGGTDYYSPAYQDIRNRAYQRPVEPGDDYAVLTGDDGYTPFDDGQLNF